MREQRVGDGECPHECRHFEAPITRVERTRCRVPVRSPPVRAARLRVLTLQIILDQPRLITRNWDDLLRVAGSLKLGYVSAHDLMRTFQGSGRNSTLARALGEYGRIGKTLHLLDLAA